MKLKEFLWTVSPLTLRTAPFWRRSWKHRACRLLLGGVYCYLGVLLVLLCLENRLLYRGTSASESWTEPPEGITVEDVDLPTTGGGRVHAWWSMPHDWLPGDGALVFFHGNGGNLSHRGGCIPEFHRRLRTGVLLVDYPGFGRSDGAATEAGCYAAGDAAYDWLTESRHVSADRLILYGGSLGGGIATDLASRRPHRALVLVSAFTSFPDQAQTLYPWLPARWLVRNQFNNVAKVASVTGPVFVAHARTDGLIPFAMGQRLFEAARGRKQFCPMNTRYHSDVLDPEGMAALQKFLEEGPPATSD
jgi:pimeloyl-ACP methyl ester carboxylesterase